MQSWAIVQWCSPESPMIALLPGEGILTFILLVRRSPDSGHHRLFPGSSHPMLICNFWAWVGVAPNKHPSQKPANEISHCPNRPDFQAEGPLLTPFLLGKKTGVDRSEERLFRSSDILNLEFELKSARGHMESSYDLFEILRPGKLSQDKGTGLAVLRSIPNIQLWLSPGLYQRRKDWWKRALKFTTVLELNLCLPLPLCLWQTWPWTWLHSHSIPNKIFHNSARILWTFKISVLKHQQRQITSESLGALAFGRGQDSSKHQHHVNPVLGSAIHQLWVLEKLLRLPDPWRLQRWNEANNRVDSTGLLRGCYDIKAVKRASHCGWYTTGIQKLAVVVIIISPLHKYWLISAQKSTFPWTFGEKTWTRPETSWVMVGRAALRADEWKCFVLFKW